MKKTYEPLEQQCKWDFKTCQNIFKDEKHSLNTEIDELTKSI